MKMQGGFLSLEWHWRQREMENVISLAMIARACKQKRFLIKTIEKHCREKGHAEGGYEL
jgi:hypothetical protein